MSAKVFKHRFKVPSSAIDVRNHVNNLAYLQWCLDAAESHWEQNASEEMRSQYVWYVLNHNIDYKASAFEGDELEIKTWVAYAEGVKSERHYEILNANTGRILVTAKTLWCFLNAKSLKPTKIPEEIRNLF
ncbi:thioesterase family protein [Aureisphaera galaxeae]|uniref:acyl-CoA thioesterase n=1 Tax=Aureisphaera galaxeae TaxID=1538023 RepID=UPI002350AE7C|nr:thioesterase family protein [Aureisphaera galaxeae]MDC8005977.1 thioesterase family protein [Aureisphaera galaxeae]